MFQPPIVVTYQVFKIGFLYILVKVLNMLFRVILYVLIGFLTIL